MNHVLLRNLVPSNEYKLQCGDCNQWWSIQEPVISKEVWYCPHCARANALAVMPGNTEWALVSCPHNEYQCGCGDVHLNDKHIIHWRGQPWSIYCAFQYALHLSCGGLEPYLRIGH